MPQLADGENFASWLFINRYDTRVHMLDVGYAAVVGLICIRQAHSSRRLAKK